jgi:hypothetical protein
MRAIQALVTAVGLVAVIGSSVAAQDEGDVAAWYAMMFTPFGALPPLATSAMLGVPATSARTPITVEAKYGHWAFDEVEEPWNIYGLGARAGAVGLVLGYARCEGCDDGVIMGGVDFETTIVKAPIGASPQITTLSIGLRPALGFAKPTGDAEGSALSAAIDVPFAYSVQLGQGMRIAPFVAPGFGYGRFDEGESLLGDDGAESGTRASIAAGVGLLLRDRFGIHLAWRKIIIEDGPSTFGVGLSIRD